MSVREFGFKSLLACTRKIPQMARASGIVNRIVKPLYLRYSRSPVQTDVLGLSMELYPEQAVDGTLLFAPQLYDYREISFLKENLQHGDCFVDVGAYIGFYTLMASRLVGESGRVIAIEGNPDTFKRLHSNLESNEVQNVLALRGGVSDKEETRQMWCSQPENFGANSFHHKFKDDEPVADITCETLDKYLENAGVTKITAMKFDIEGWESRVLFHFFQARFEQLFPNYLIFEHLMLYQHDQIMELLKSWGYTLVEKTRDNYILAREPIL